MRHIACHMPASPSRLRKQAPKEAADPYATSGVGEGEDDEQPVNSRWYHLNPTSRLMSLWDAVCVLALIFTALITCVSWSR